MPSSIHRFLLGVLMLGVLGMGAELLLIGHVEGVLQRIPVMLLALGLGVLMWFAIAPGSASLAMLRVTMVLFVLSGVVGVVLHFRGNAQFELEMRPSLEGLELVGRTLTGATPVLAPGSMALLGLVGLAVSHRQPMTQPIASRGGRREVES
jgi:hypothetical protein